MASTETRSGFRLPWSSDRSNDAAAPGAADTVAADAKPAGAADPAWPSTDVGERLHLSAQPRPADPAGPDADPTPPEEPAMIHAEPVAAAPAAPRKSSKLMADLSAAIRATAESAREQALAQVDADVTTVVEQIRTGAKDGENSLRRRSDEDIAAIKDWSRAEIARIKDETEQRITARRRTLDEELAGHAAAIDVRVGEVEEAATAFRADMDAYAARLLDEDDPALLATMAESMPEPPALDAWANLEDLDLVSLTTESPDATAGSDAPGAGEPAGPDAPAVAWGDAEGTGWTGSGTDVTPSGPDDEVPADVAPHGVDGVDGVDGGPAGSPTAAWGDGHDAWAAPTSTQAENQLDPESEGGIATAVATAEDAPDGEAAGADGPRWTAGEDADGSPTGETEAGDPVDRGAIMAALEAAAEAVVAAESAAESADQAEAAADLAETAAELLKGRVDPDAELDPEAAAALSARVGAGGFEESYADRLASLLPGNEATGDGEPRTTQVVVSGLVSVASIASFKRHLGRLAGVTAVAVASGPEGEFLFNVTHRPDVSFRDAVPTMPGFAARVTGSTDGVVNVTARDPESEG
jgi:hypothetical protein